MKAFICFIAAVIAVGLGAQAARAQTTGDPAGLGAPAGATTAGVIVQFRASAQDNQIVRSLRSHGLQLKKRVQTAPMREKGEHGLYVVHGQKPLDQTIRELQQDPEVELAEPNWVYHHQAIATDPYFSAGNLWGLYGDNTTPANGYGTQASKAWASGYTGTNTVYIGIIDEGIQWQHPDLTENVWNNPFDPPNGIDDDGNGYVDDAHGWDFYSGDASIYDSTGDDHGTHVAGTIGARGSNGIGVAGVNWNVTLISAKFMGADGGSTIDAVAAIDYMVDLKRRHGLNVVALNNSWGGGGYSQSLHAAILRAAKAEILFVAAAGNGDAQGVGINNDTTASYPANYDTTKAAGSESAASFNSVIAVAAIDSRGNLAAFSNYGATRVHLGAPGVGIWSTVPSGTYAAYDGTSMATPHVTGAVALYASTHPTASAASIRNALLTSVIPTASLAGKTSTGGRLNLSTIIASTVSAPSNTNVLSAATLTAPRVQTNSFRFSLRGGTNQIYDLQMSTNLTVWTIVGTVTNTTGTINLVEQAQVTGASRKFFRAVAR